MVDDPQGLVAAIMRDTRVAMLTYTDDAGRLVSIPMGTQDFEDPGTVPFITGRSTDKVAANTARPRVNVAYAAGVFMSGGPDDPDSTLLEVTGDTAHYWDSPGRVSLIIQLAKGLLTDAHPDPGESDVVDLGHS